MRPLFAAPPRGRPVRLTLRCAQGFAIYALPRSVMCTRPRCRSICSRRRPEGTRRTLTLRFAPGFAIYALPRSVMSGEAAVDGDVAEFGGGRARPSDGVALVAPGVVGVALDGGLGTEIGGKGVGHPRA
ncbi:MAG: hypothetical protein JJT96_18495 [Opitutales bacterium]|nr:hypothetical protein [Opitutales bacterium]